MVAGALHVAKSLAGKDVVVSPVGTQDGLVCPNHYLAKVDEEGRLPLIVANSMGWRVHVQPRAIACTYELMEEDAQVNVIQLDRSREEGISVMGPARKVRW